MPVLTPESLEEACRLLADEPTVRRCPALERLLAEGAAVASPDDLLPAIRQDVMPIDDVRSTAAYRERVMARVLYYALRGTAWPE